MELSLETFNRAKQLKRDGHYSDAIYIYKQEVQKMINYSKFDELPVYANALAKCFYLNKEFKKALFCYVATIHYTMFADPSIFSSYKSRDMKFRKFASVICVHIGYCLNGWDSQYAASISGKGVAYDPEKYVNDGVDFLFNQFDLFLRSKDFGPDLIIGNVFRDLEEIGLDLSPLKRR